jgi:hypothetical protein
MRPIVLSSIAAAWVLALGACTTPQAVPQAVPQAAAAKPASAATKTAAGQPAKICTSRVVTGSLMPVHECHTAEEWAEIKSRGEDAFSLQAQRQLPSKGGN